MDERVEKFVEIYNKVMDWNKDILDVIMGAFNTVPKYTKDFIDDYLPTEKINGERFDLEHAKLFEFERDVDGEEVYELQAFNNESYGTSYFWVFPNEDEQRYKTRKLEQLDNHMYKKISDLTTKIAELKAENEEWTALLDAIMSGSYETKTI